MRSNGAGRACGPMTERRGALEARGDAPDRRRAGAERSTRMGREAEEDALGRRYRSIYLAGATFNLLPDDATAAAALGRIRDHLDPAGAALIPLFIPPDVPPGHTQEHRTAAGSVMRCTTVSADRDEGARQQVNVLRYELEQDGRSTSLERPWVLHWHTQEGFRALAEAAGLTVTAVLAATGEPAAPDADQFTFLLGVA